MVTSEQQSQYRNGVYSSTATFFGLSTDTKPTGDTAGNGSCFLEMDTGKIWFYDTDGGRWLEWGA